MDVLKGITLYFGKTIKKEERDNLYKEFKKMILNI